MRLDCPHCDTRLALDPPTATPTELAEADGRLLGRRHVCRGCGNELGIYHY